MKHLISQAILYGRMLSRTLDLAYENAKSILDKLNSVASLEILERIQDYWVRYIPRDKDHYRCIGGLDSGFNWRELRGFFLYVVNALYIDTCYNREEGVEIDLKILTLNPQDLVELRSIALELKTLNKVIGDSKRLVLVDGSILSKLLIILRASSIIRDSSIVEEVIEEAEKLLSRDLSRVVFLSKNSGSHEILRRLTGGKEIPDLYLLEEYTSGIGFTRPIKLSLEYLNRSIDFMISYARLDVRGPIIRIEYFKSEEDSFMKVLIDSLHRISIGGYPLVLSLADREVRISEEDLDKILRILDLGRENVKHRIKLR